MKTGYMITRYMTKKKNETSHIITPPNFVMRAGKAPGVFMKMKQMPAMHSKKSQIKFLI